MSLSFESQFDSTLAEDSVFEEPPEYRVILLNDDFTTKDFVELILEKVFHKSQEEAVSITEFFQKMLGTSANVAKAKGMKIIALTGKDGGEIKEEKFH